MMLWHLAMDGIAPSVSPYLSLHCAEGLGPTGAGGLPICSHLICLSSGDSHSSDSSGHQSVPLSNFSTFLLSENRLNIRNS